MRNWYMIAVISIFSQQALAQDIPDTDIYLAPLQLEAGKAVIGALQNITSRAGYDNQPMFAPDGKSIYYTAQMADGQAETFRYDVADRSIRRITTTPESEYSPTPMPDGMHFSVVRVEKDSVQRLWRFPLAGGEPSLVFENITNVGYHTWADDTTAALFIVGPPHKLLLANVNSGKAIAVAENIGRSLHKIPGQRAISFVHKPSEEAWWIKRLDLQSLKIEPIITTPPEAEDMAWSPDGRIFMGHLGAVYVFTPGPASHWQKIADFSKQGLAEITRLAVSPDGKWLALVAMR